MNNALLQHEEMKTYRHNGEINKGKAQKSGGYFSFMNFFLNCFSSACNKFEYLLLYIVSHGYCRKIF